MNKKWSFKKEAAALKAIPSDSVEYKKAFDAIHRRIMSNPGKHCASCKGWNLCRRIAYIALLLSYFGIFIIVLSGGDTNILGNPDGSISAGQVLFVTMCISVLANRIPHMVIRRRMKEFLEDYLYRL